MPGILDFIDAPKDSMLGMLNLPPGQGFGDVPKDKDAEAKALWERIQAETDKQNAGADRRNAAGLAASQIPSLAPAAPVAGASLPAIDPTLAASMALGQAPATPFGALSPQTAPSAPVAQAPVTLPQQRPTIPPPSQPLPPPVANAQASAPIDQTTTPGQAPQAQPSAPRPGFMDGLNNYIDTHRGQLMALAGGMAGAPTLGMGLGRGFTQAAAALPADQKLMMQQGAIGPTYRALISAGVPKEQALAAVYNPTILKSVTENYLGDRKQEHVTTKDAFGVEHVQVFNPYTGKVTDPQGSGGTGAAENSAFYAPGVTSIDQSKVGDEFLNQFSPEVKAAVHSYINGDTMPSPRTQGAMQQIKLIAQKYGNDVGTPSDDTTYVKRRQFQQQMGSSTPNSFGGQVKAFRQGLDHMGTLADNIEKYGPSTGLGSTDLAHESNAVSEHGTRQKDLANQINASAQSVAGEIGKLFSGASGGGVHERDLTRGRFGSTNSGPEQAGSLEATIELMQGGLNALKTHAEEVMGPGRAPQLVGEAEQKKIEHIQGVIARLRGQQAAQSDAAPASVQPTTATGPNGHKIVVQNGRWVDAQTGQPVQ